MTNSPAVYWCCILVLRDRKQSLIAQVRAAEGSKHVERVERILRKDSGTGTEGIRLRIGKNGKNSWKGRCTECQCEIHQVAISCCRSRFEAWLERMLHEDSDMEI